MTTATAEHDAALDLGARNLLLGCAQARPGESLLIVEEDSALGYYGAGLAEAIAGTAASLGLSVRIAAVPFQPEIDELPTWLLADMAPAEHVLFLARLGDQLRFQALPTGLRPIVSYVLDTAMLASPLGTCAYAGFVGLKTAIDRMFAAAHDIRITCERGTDLRGHVENARPGADVSVRRFPMTVFSPIGTRHFTGRVAVAHCLAGTGARYYRPYGVRLQTTLSATIDGNRITGWEGEPADVARAKAQYRHVADRFGIDPDYVHSWHAGIHPGCAYSQPAYENFERWSGGAFGNPRLLHFHTCGASAPGEICWNILDPTITVDGEAIWERGTIRTDRIAGASDILAEHPAMEAVFAQPARYVGLD